MSRSFIENETTVSDFNMKIMYPDLFAKISNDNTLFVFLESCFNEKTDKEGDLWIIPRSNLEDFKKVK
jgi:hypothetical protein